MPGKTTRNKIDRGKMFFMIDHWNCNPACAAELAAKRLGMRETKSTFEAAWKQPQPGRTIRQSPNSVCAGLL